MKIDERAIGMYKDDLFSLQMIGEFFNCSRQGAKKYLNKRGIDTSYRKHLVICDNCGTEFNKPRSYIRNCIKNYCTVKCYYESLHNPEYNGNRQGQRVARKLVDELLISIGKRLMPEWVVHHEDGNDTNNDPENLIVFASQADHMRWHRGNRESVEPIWVGKSVIESKSISKRKVAQTKADIISSAKSKIAEISSNQYFNPMPKVGKK